MMATLQQLYGAAPGNLSQLVGQSIGLIPLPTGPTGVPLSQPSLVYNPETGSMEYAKPPEEKKDEKK